MSVSAPYDTAPDVRISEVAISDQRQMDTVAAMHMELLGFGPMAGLGIEFVRDACYGLHMKEGVLKVALYEIGGQPAGFVAWTDRSISFHRRSLRRHWLYVGWLIAKSVIRHPGRIPALLRAVRVVFSRRGETHLGQDPMGEVICVAVRPGYLKARFRHGTGLKPSEELIRYAAAHLRNIGIDQMRMLVDYGNKPVLMLYHLLGARFEPYTQAGEPMVQVWFELDALISGAAATRLKT